MSLFETDGVKYSESYDVAINGPRAGPPRPELTLLNDKCGGWQRMSLSVLNKGVTAPFEGVREVRSNPAPSFSAAISTQVKGSSLFPRIEGAGYRLCYPLSKAGSVLEKCAMVGVIPMLSIIEFLSPHVLDIGDDQGCETHCDVPLNYSRTKHPNSLIQHMSSKPFRLMLPLAILTSVIPVPIHSYDADRVESLQSAEKCLSNLTDAMFGLGGTVRRKPVDPALSGSSTPRFAKVSPLSHTRILSREEAVNLYITMPGREKRSNHHATGLTNMVSKSIRTFPGELPARCLKDMNLSMQQLRSACASHAPIPFGASDAKHSGWVFPCVAASLGAGTSGASSILNYAMRTIHPTSFHTGLRYLIACLTGNSYVLDTIHNSTIRDSANEGTFTPGCRDVPAIRQGVGNIQDSMFYRRSGSDALQLVVDIFLLERFNYVYRETIFDLTLHCLSSYLLSCPPLCRALCDGTSSEAQGIVSRLLRDVRDEVYSRKRAYDATIGKFGTSPFFVGLTSEHSTYVLDVVASGLDSYCSHLDSAFRRILVPLRSTALTRDLRVNIGSRLPADTHHTGYVALFRMTLSYIGSRRSVHFTNMHEINMLNHRTTFLLPYLGRSDLIACSTASGFYVGTTGDQLIHSGGVIGTYEELGAVDRSRRNHFLFGCSEPNADDIIATAEHYSQYPVANSIREIRALEAWANRAHSCWFLTRTASYSYAQAKSNELSSLFPID